MTNTRLHQARILVADDQQTNRELAIFFLKNAGFTIFAEAADGAETLEQVAHFKPDIILLDILMPEPNGFDICKKLKANPATAQIPILFLSGLTDIKNRTMGYQLGAVDYVHKPIDRYEMCARVTVHLTNSLMSQDLQLYKNRISQELAQARDLQLGLLPQERQLTELTRQYPLKINHHFNSSSELSGDYWGVFPAGDRLAIITLDFTGHGIAAALNSLRCHALLLEIQSRLSNPLTFMHELNSRLQYLLPTGQFATCALVLINQKGEAFALTAGTPPLTIHHAKKKTYSWITGRGTPLGAVESSHLSLSTHEFILDKGDSLLLYSDALVESLHNNDKRWGIAGLKKHLKTLAEKPKHQPVPNITKLFYATANQPLHDDLTLVSIQRI